MKISKIYRAELASIADIIVVGVGKDKSEADKNMNKNIQNSQNRCKERHINVNTEKENTHKQTKITFMGHTITDSGIKPDPNKIKTITDMSEPVDINGVKQFCGMIQYLSRFIPNVASTLEPICELAKMCGRICTSVKNQITQTSALGYFDQTKQVTIHVASSKSSLGAALLQEGKPIEYASRALTVNKRN